MSTCVLRRHQTKSRCFRALWMRACVWKLKSMIFAGSASAAHSSSPSLLRHGCRSVPARYTSGHRPDPALPFSMSRQYLRCTPLAHLFQSDTDKHRSNVLLHAESKWAKGEAAPTNLAEGRGICVNSHFDSGNIEVDPSQPHQLESGSNLDRPAHLFLGCAGGGNHAGPGQRRVPRAQPAHS